MSIRVALNHKTAYRYDRLVTLGPQVVRLRPAPHCRTPILSYSLKVTPQQHFLNWQQDPQSNYLARLVVPEKTRDFVVEVDLVAEMTVINPFDFFLEPAAEEFPFEYEPSLLKELRPYLEKIEPETHFARFLPEVNRKKRRTIDFLIDLNQQLMKAIRYVIRMEPGVQTCEETLALRSGSCRDSAWLMVQTLRHMGLAARFVSGYLIQLVPDIKSLDGPQGAVHDFTDLHAWAEVYLPGAGWIGLDPTSGLLAGEGHIPLACTPDPSSAAPITGASDVCETEFDVSMTITRVLEDPRVTKPYTDEQWRTIEALGQRIDEQLNRGDVRLTMGGEPTFVSIDDMEGEEWNTAAVGPTKRRLADNLIRRLRQRFAPQGLLHFGQGKWYPGESLPRWAFTLYWRVDGQPTWLNPDLLANETDTYEHTADDARRFTLALAERLEVGPKWIVPTYEDVAHYLLKEQRLPINVDPRDPKLKDPEERSRMVRLFESGVGGVVGYVLPLRRPWWQSQPRWVSGPWPVRSNKMFLLPGDSPIGFRLPIDSLPWIPVADIPHVYEVDPLAERAPLPARPPQRFVKGADGARTVASQQTGQRLERPQKPTTAAELERDTSSPLIRTAMCVEPRNGRLHVFIPPVETLEDYLELIAAIEDTAASVQLPVVIEGYTPPHDHRLQHIKVTPDPGVIEVNIQPSRNWTELVQNTSTVYEEAHQSRLGTEKFMIDGRHLGTGGGNHVVLGGATPADSPFLRRPDVLKSLVGYWNNHPSLSYLFSGMFIGPTSQSPRVDEGRRDSIYELQIAFDQIPDRHTCAPWLVDRIFRNLLVDLTGNTHRAEFCIDKLYSPDSSSGRLGLLEFRAFEMPPHSRMSLTQQLLIRALVARFWEQPYREKLINWGTAIHDRFMLPYFVQQDFETVIAEMRLAGFPLDSAWFAPHFEFRFPVIGDVVQQAVRIELRSAIEPWYVLGEEPAGGGTTRFVDSSVERLQVRVTGLTDHRHIITCNGRKVPLCATGTVGEYIAGVRYRAWQPPSCLHPLIPVHTPLVFDLLDTWLGRSAGGCTYHVAHPGGRSHDTFPVNAYEAESRRIARFSRMGHTPGGMVVPRDEPNPDFPMTLDMRRRVP